MGVYLRAERLDQALDALSARTLTILAGGTDYFPARVGQPLDDDVLDITGLEALRGIEDRGDHWRIGALATWSDLIRADLPPAFDGLRAAARAVGGVQIQNTGTLAGNICNASPAGDGAPNLLALDASVVLASAQGERSVPVADFVNGNRMTARGAGELVIEITVPRPAGGAAGAFVKLGARKYLVISIVMVAIVIEPAKGEVGQARVVVGACAPVSRRLGALEQALAGQKLGDGLAAVAQESHLRDVLAPIGDIRGSADYRREAALTLVRRGLSELGAKLEGSR
ncbi:MAG: FAD binding domain-containing protein [Alphaproteobacteria bacterium]